MDEYESIPMEDEAVEPADKSSSKDLGLALKRALSSGDGEAICEMVKKIVSEE